jgi:hypothetical protein
MASWLYFLRKVAALSTEGRERLEIGGASGHSHSGAGLSSDWGAGSHSLVSDGIALEEVFEAGAEFTVEPPSSWSSTFPTGTGLPPATSP